MTEQTRRALILIFNPDTDYALAAFDDNYTSPKAVALFTRANAGLLLPFAGPDDIIAPYDDPRAAAKAVASLRAEGITPIIRPWGWNPTICRRLIAAGVDSSPPPSRYSLLALRNLAHRRTTIAANHLLNQLLAEAGANSRHISPLPKEFTDADAALGWLDTVGDAFFKMPWSSSGRGVIRVADFTDSRREELRKWLSGAIRRQGSVMGETAADKCLDFATEWWIGATDRREVKFLGLSVFAAGDNGRYLANSDADDTELLNKIRSVAPDFGDIWIEAQRAMLSRIVAPGYQGPVGIDMLASTDGAIRGCIELNLRLTMGLIRTPGWRAAALENIGG